MNDTRTSGFAPIRDYAAIGDGCTLALVARDGHVDWLALPAMHAPATFAALLDPAAGGSFILEPVVPYRTTRRYVPGTNVLETTFVTAGGAVRVTDALTLDNGAPLPWRELARRIEHLGGSVPMHWRITPRVDFGTAGMRLTADRGRVTGSDERGRVRVVVSAFDAGDVVVRDGGAGAAFTAEAGRRSLVALVAVSEGPVPFPARGPIERRIDDTVRAWRAWSDRIRYAGPWRDGVVRSALALRCLLYTPTGALAAAPTTSLPERIGGDRNYDYRYAWTRDSSFALDALLRLDLEEEAQRMTAWLAAALVQSHPEIEVFYDLGGGPADPGDEGELDLPGYRGSRPVRRGNSAHGQLQLGNYGDLFETFWLYHRRGNRLDDRTAQALTTTADHVCDIWDRRDNGIWELREPAHYTISKVGAWVALDRAQRFAAAGTVDASHARRWNATAAEIRGFVEACCWSEARQSYTMAAGDERLDASCVLIPRTGFHDAGTARVHSTIAAIRDELGSGPFLYRFSGARDIENAFVACSFWLVEALAATGALDEAASIMDAMVGAANDVGLYSEEIDPGTYAMLGNFPQALSHLALLTAASSFEESRRARPS